MRHAGLAAFAVLVGCDGLLGLRHLGPPGPDAPPSWYGTYRHRKHVRILPPNFNELDQFPVAILGGDDPDLVAGTRPDSGDLVITDASSATALPFEIERFDATTGRLVA